MKTTLKTLMAFVMLGMISASAFAQQVNSNTANPPATTVVSTGFTPGSFIDADKNGVCDNFEKRVGTHRGRNFVDANGDGVCDRRNSAGKGNCNKRNGNWKNGRQKGCGQGNGCGAGYGGYHGGR